MNRENSMLEGSQLSIFFGASKYSSEKTDGNSDEKCWSCWDSGFAFNVLSSKQMSLGKSGWVLAIITLPASHWESTSSTVLLKKIRTSELQDPWIHVSNANVEVPSFRHLSLVGVLPWYNQTSTLKEGNGFSVSRSLSFRCFDKSRCQFQMLHHSCQLAMFFGSSFQLLDCDNGRVVDP